MVIAVNAGSFWNNTCAEDFIYETVSRLINLHQQIQFILIFDEPPGTEIFAANVTPVFIKSRNNSVVNSFTWYNIKLAAILKKYKADIFITPSFCSLIRKVPQVLISPKTSVHHCSQKIKKINGFLFSKLIPACLKKAKLIINLSVFEKTIITKKYNIDAGKVEVIYEGVSETFIPATLQVREEVKNKYANGNEYFVFVGEIGADKNLLNLLRAFSAFKKRQKSSMQLIITGKVGWKSDTVIEDLRLFKFKDEVKVLAGLQAPGVQKILAAAYAMVYPSIEENIAAPVLQAMSSNVPVITSSVGMMPELCGAGALYADTTNFKETAIKMMQVFRDEDLRKALIDKAKLNVLKYNWNLSATRLWEAIEKTIAQ